MMFVADCYLCILQLIFNFPIIISMFSHPKISLHISRNTFFRTYIFKFKLHPVLILHQSFIDFRYLIIGFWVIFESVIFYVSFPVIVLIIYSSLNSSQIFESLCAVYDSYYVKFSQLIVSLKFKTLSLSYPCCTSGRI